MSPARFCHVGVVYENAFYIFGGYDGSARLNDFLMFRLDQCKEALAPTLVKYTTAMLEKRFHNMYWLMCIVDFRSSEASQH